MSKDWNLSDLLQNLHGDVEHRLSTVRTSFQHPVLKGDGAENIWVDLFNQYLPNRYQASRAFVVDSENNFSQQMDVVIFDQQYSPLIFHYADQLIIPAESVYAVFEVKQTLNKDHINAAKAKVASVRKLHRTSLPIPHAGGFYPPKPLFPILGGLLSLEKEPAIDTVKSYFTEMDESNLLNLGCSADSCYFYYQKDNHEHLVIEHKKATTTFLFELLSQLQQRATVPMIDIHAYGKWLK